MLISDILALSDPRNYTLPDDMSEVVAPTFDDDADQDGNEFADFEDDLYSVDLNSESARDIIDSD
jgi:hypothetical protein